MTKIYYGCNEIPRSWGRYSALCNAVEADLGQLDHPPRIETLNQWRVKTPKGFGFILHANPTVVQGLVQGAKQNAPGLQEATLTGWKQTEECARALAARAILIRTPLSFSPGSGSRAQMKAFAEELGAKTKTVILWEAEGMWDPIITREWAAELGLTFVYDPFLALREEEGLLGGDGGFLVTERAGMRRDFDRYDIGGLLDQLGSYDRAFFLLRGRFKWQHAKIFHELVGED